MKRNTSVNKAKYTPTLHAIDRARHRLGMKTTEAAEWFNEAMREATYIISQRIRGRAQLVYEYKNIRLIVDETARQIVTIYPMFNTDILTPVFERERRRLTREVTRNVRALELDKAHLLVEYGDKAVNCARARNPQTQELIKAQMDEVKARISGLDRKITREQDRLTNFEKAVGVYR